MASNQNISKRRKAVADGVFYAELSEFFMRELANEGYSGCEVRVTHARTEIIIRATHTQVSWQAYIYTRLNCRPRCTVLDLTSCPA